MEQDEAKSQTIMVGASFEEIDSAAVAAVKKAMKQQLEKITLTI